MSGHLGISIGGRHTYQDFGLFWLVPYSVELPQPATNYISVPGADGAKDFTESLGGVRYGQRSAAFAFRAKEPDYYAYESKCMELAAYVHGKKHAIVLDTEPTHFFSGRLEVAFEKSAKDHSKITLKGLMDPWRYKIDMTSASVVIGSGGTATLSLMNEMRDVNPLLEVQGGAVEIVFEGASYSIPEGSLYVAGIRLAPGENTLNISGSPGTSVTATYREGTL